MLSAHVDRYDKRDKCFFAGYNGIFDLNFLHAFFKKCGDQYFGSYVWWPSIDVSVMAEAEAVFDGLLADVRCKIGGHNA